MVLEYSFKMAEKVVAATIDKKDPQAIQRSAAVVQKKTGQVRKVTYSTRKKSVKRQSSFPVKYCFDFILSSLNLIEEL